MRYRDVFHYYNEDVDVNDVIQDTDNLYFIAFSDFELTLYVYYRKSDDEFLFLGEIITDGSFIYEEKYNDWKKDEVYEYYRVKDMCDFVRSAEHLAFYEKSFTLQYVAPMTNPGDINKVLIGQHEIVYDFTEDEPNCMFYCDDDFDTIDTDKIAAQALEELMTALLYKHVKAEKTGKVDVKKASNQFTL